MKPTKIGIIREGKNPPDSRVPLIPEQARELKEQHPALDISCQTSLNRCYTDAEYIAEGINVVDDISDCDILLGVKEVLLNQLIPDKTYLFFSHTIKEQPYNQDLLRYILDNNIRLIDYECLVKDSKRVIAFGHWAGIVGAYNGLLGYGKRNGLFDLKRAKDCHDLLELKMELSKIDLPGIKILLTGKGRVGMGALEILETAGIRKVNPKEFLTRSFKEPVFTQVDVDEYHRRIDGKSFEISDFFQNPEAFESIFLQYAKEVDLLISAIYWDPGAPKLFTLEQMQDPDFKIKLIADITCDINGSIPSTQRACTIADPFYDFDPYNNLLHAPFSSEQFVTVMAVDNLPDELPRDSSHDFGNQLVENVLLDIISNNPSEMIENATITQNGSLTEKYQYLHNYAYRKK
ncbi:NAD(P)-dependent oxidoreductase [Bacteroidota bacterium]